MRRMATISTGFMLFAAGLGSPARATDARDSLAGLYNDMAVSSALRNEWTEARSLFDSATTYYRTSPAILNNIGNYYACNGELDSAVSRYKRAVELDSAFRAPLYNWAIVAYLAGGAEQKAFDMAADAIEYSKKDPGLRSIIKIHFEDIDIRKGDPTRVSDIEIRQLLAAARERVDTALVRNRERTQAEDTLEMSERPPDRTSDFTTTGGKAADTKELATRLYWITYGSEPARRSP